MPRSKNGIQRIKPSVVDMENAGNAVLRDGVSARVAAQLYNVSRSTLVRHISKNKKSGNKEFVYSGINAVYTRLVFTKDEEPDVIKYINLASSLHYGLTTRTTLQKLAFQYAKILNKHYPSSWNIKQEAGKNWFKLFVDRHPYLAPKTVVISPNFNKQNVDKFFKNLTDIVESHSMKSSQIYNVNEIEIPIIPDSVKKSEDATIGVNIVTLIIAINASGRYIPPLFILPTVNFDVEMLKGAPEGSIGIAHSLGWSTSEIFTLYLNHFIEHTNPTEDNKILIILNNHESHISVPTFKLTEENNILLLTVPPHTNHNLQPLENNIFSLFKTQYNTECNEWINSNTERQLTISGVAERVGKIYPLVFTSKNILEGFNLSRIWPLNRDSSLKNNSLSNEEEGTLQTIKKDSNEIKCAASTSKTNTN